MNITELKNYGRSFFEILYDLPEDIIKLAEKTLLAEVKKDLGYLALAKLGWKVKKEISVRTKQDWSSLQLGLPREQRFLEDAIKKTALMKVLVDMVGREKAAAIHRRFYDRVADDLIGCMFPSVDDFTACGDTFVCLKDYCRSTVEPNRRAGTHLVEIADVSGSGFIYRVKYCLLHAVAAGFGDPYLCYPSSCYGDEVFFPGMCVRAGLRFSRNGTLAEGGDACEFIFSRPEVPDQS